MDQIVQTKTVERIASPPSFEDLDPFTIAALGAPSDAFHGSADTSPVENVS